MAEPGWGQPIVRAIIIGNAGGVVSIGVVDQGAPGAQPWKVDDDATQALLAAIQTLLAAGLPSALSSDRLKVESTGNVAAAAADSGNPVKTGGKYNTSAPTLTNGNRGDTQLDVNANTLTSLGTLISGESQTFNTLETSQKFISGTAAAAGTTVIKSGAARLKRVIFGTLVGGGTCKIYDNTAASGTVLLDTVTVPGTITADNPFVIDLDEAATLGITVVMTGTAFIATVVYL